MKGWFRKRKLTLYAATADAPTLGIKAWQLAKSLEVLRSQVNAAWPGRKRTSDGTIGDAAHAARDSDHNPWVKDGALGIVTAIDITDDPGSGCDANIIVTALAASRDARIKYIIWNRQILSSSVKPWIWRSYTGKNPHNKHFHLSVLSDKVHYNDIAEWSLP